MMQPNVVRRALTSAWLVALCALAGCRSKFVDADVRNVSGAPISVVEVDYPSASFGRETLAAGAEFHYRFKLQGSGATTVSWIDAAHHAHSVKGPQLHEGQQGHVLIQIGANAAGWQSTLTE